MELWSKIGETSFMEDLNSLLKKYRKLSVKKSNVSAGKEVLKSQILVFITRSLKCNNEYSNNIMLIKTLILNITIKEIMVINKTTAISAIMHRNKVTHSIKATLCMKKRSLVLKR